MDLLKLLKGIADPGDSDETLTIYLALAEDVVLNTMFPHGYDDSATVPRRYGMTQVRIANELLARRGSEGQDSHSENGISRGFDGADVSPSLLSKITPHAGVF